METRRLPPMEGAPTPHPSTAHHAPPYRQPGPPPAPPPHPPPPGSINTNLPSVAATFNPQHHSATAPSSLPPYPRDRINTDAQERATHEYKYEYNRSQHGTPVNRLPPDPYPRTPSTPAPPSIPPPPGGLPERPPMEGPHPGYGPDHYAPQYMHHGPPPPEHMMAHQTEPMYHHAPHGYQMLYNPTVAVNAASAASLANRKKSMRASQVSSFSFPPYHSTRLIT
ncbi:hypothetical protein M8818_004653 [Zalaria obscura]|uniref:Uncharacterized protein n=1 Tax=Zalaria obscura TaxID=2024903 RepID=A0ACC3SCF6_9PEZI